MSNKITNSRGFTLVELMIATVIFSVILLLISAGMIQVGRLFYKGSTSVNTQEVARTILDDISQAIQFSGETVTLPTAVYPNRFCVGSRRYTYALGTRLTNSNQVFLVDQFSSTCNDSTPPNNLAAPNAGSRELMGFNMRLTNLVITPGPNNTYSITVKVLYGENDTMSNPTTPNAECLNERSTSQFCAASELSTTVKKRIE
jgi:prepilin-type N-terminal cleavage/methylation domain-containing protein